MMLAISVSIAVAETTSATVSRSVTTTLSALSARARQLRTRATLERDYWSFRRRYGHVLGGRFPSGGGVALIASLTYSSYQVKQEGMIAKAFALKGLEPVAVMLPDAAMARRYLELFGVRRFVDLGEFLDEAAEREAQREAQALLDSVREPSDLKQLTFRGADVGRQALSTVSRYLHEGGVDLDDPQARALLSELLPSAIRTAIASEALLDEYRPDVVLFNERNYADQGPLCDLALARGLNIIQFVGGFEDDTLVFKRYTEETKALHPRSISDDSWPLVAAMDWTPEHDRALDAEFARRYDRTATFLARWNQGWTRRQPRHEIVSNLGLDPAKRTAVVFSHVLWDANMFFGRDLFADQEQWFVETVRAACANDKLNWVVKLHPANVWKRKRDGVAGELDEVVAIRERIGELPPHVHLLTPDTDISTWSLFDVTDWGVTIRGSIGFELPCFGKPALTAGTGFYSGRGFTVDSENREEYLERLRSLENVPPPTDDQVALARKHAYTLFRLRQTRFTSFRSVFQPVEHVDRPFEASIEISLRSADELRQAQDLRRLGDWAVDSRALDYLEADPLAPGPRHRQEPTLVPAESLTPPG
jgi:hypothetical protein